MIPPLFISYYTPDYAEVTERLKASLSALALPFRVDSAIPEDVFPRVPMEEALLAAHPVG